MYGPALKDRKMMKKTKVFRISLLLFALLFLLCSCNSGKFSDLKKESDPLVLPVLRIETEEGKEVADRENYLPMTLSVSGSANGTYDLPALGGGIRGRGNSTWDFCEKKSYKLKLNLKVNLLGTGTGGEKDWALISNAREKSMLRNYSMFLLAKKMGISPVTGCNFVEVYLNGDYIGVYLLCETPEAAENRLDLGEESGETEVGYLLELDKRAKAESQHSYEYFYVNDWAVPFAVKSHIENKAQNAYIKSYVERADDAILSGERSRVEELVELSSLVDMYILEEFSKDRDVGFASFYVYKKEGERLQFGYPWDFDLALGNDTGEDRANEENAPDINYPDPEGVMASVLNRWFSALWQTEWFRKEVADRWAEVEPLVDETLKEVGILGFSLEEAAERNYERWDILGKKQLFEPWKVYRMGDYDDQVEYLLEWMDHRKIWLGAYFQKSVC